MDWTWPWKIKALHMQQVALLDPGGQRLQHKFQVIPGIWFCYVLGMEMFVVATAVGRCKFKCQYYSSSKYHRG